MMDGGLGSVPGLNIDFTQVRITLRGSQPWTHAALKQSFLLAVSVVLLSGAVL